VCHRISLTAGGPESVQRPDRRASPVLRRAFGALGTRNYRLYFLGQLVSQSGTWMQNIAQAWLVLELTDSPLALGTVTALQFVPVLALSLPGGVIADRLPKRGLLLATQALAMLQAFALAGLVFSNAIQLWHVYVLAALLGMATALGQPAQRALPSELVPPEQVPNAVALNSALFNAARVAGPALGGLFLATIGVAGCFLLNGVSFLFVIAALALMRLPGPAGPGPTGRGDAVRQVEEAVRYVWRTPALALPLLLVGMVGTFGYNFNVVLPLLARYELGTGALGLGIFNSALGLGSVAGALVMATRSTPSQRLVMLAAAGFSLCLAALATAPAYQLTVVLLFLQGLAGVAFTTGANTTVQLAAPGPLRGRIMSLYNVLFLGTTPFGASLTGALAESWDVRFALEVDSACCILGVLLGVAYLRRARARATRPAPPASQVSG
jgi:MFS family permease